MGNGPRIPQRARVRIAATKKKSDLADRLARVIAAPSIARAVRAELGSDTACVALACALREAIERFCEQRNESR
jgi:hypothetical protein